MIKNDKMNSIKLKKIKLKPKNDVLAAKKIKLKPIRFPSTLNLFNKQNHKKANNENRMYKSQSMPKMKTLKNNQSNIINNVPFNYNNYNDNMKFYDIIKNKYTIEDYYHKKYNLEYLNDETINYLTNIRNEEYPNYKNMRHIFKIEKITDDFLKQHLNVVCVEQTMFFQSNALLDLKYIEAIDLIILKEIQLEQNNDIKHKQEKHFKKEKDMETISDRILGYFDNSKKLNNIDSLKDIDTLGKYLKEEIDIDKELEKDKDNYIELNENNMDNRKSNIYILSALSSLLNNEGITTIIEKKCKSQKILNATLQLISSGLIVLKKYNLKLDYGSPIKNDNIILNPKERSKFQRDFIKNISKLYNLSEDNVKILEIKRGSVDVCFNLPNRVNTIKEDLKALFGKKYVDVTEKALFEGCKLSEEFLDPKGNNFGNGYEKSNFIRGGEKYDPPYEWHAYGLKVLNNYDNMNNDWLACNNNPNEWAVAYHGVGGKRGKFGRVFKNVVSIVQNNLAPGKRQFYEKYDNIRQITKDQGYLKCGRGVYLTPIIKEAEYWAEEEKFSEKKFKLIMMCRINPKKIREPDRGNENPYWILNGNSEEIRPYRILIKEL